MFPHLRGFVISHYSLHTGDTPVQRISRICYYVALSAATNQKLRIRYEKINRKFKGKIFILKDPEYLESTRVFKSAWI